MTSNTTNEFRNTLWNIYDETAIPLTNFADLFRFYNKQYTRFKIVSYM